MNEIQSLDMADAGFGEQYRGNTLPGHALYDHPLVANRTKPGYVFPKELLRILVHAWSREWRRETTDPIRGIWAWGPAGFGKTTVFEQFFCRIGTPLLSLTVKPNFCAADALRIRDIEAGETVWNDAAVGQAMREGFPVLLNEATQAQPGELSGLNDVFDRGVFAHEETGEVIVATRGFLPLIAANTSGLGDPTGDFGGNLKQNASVPTRFYKVQVDQGSIEDEVAIAASVFPHIDTSLIGQLVKGQFAINNSHSNGQLGTSMGRRTLHDWVETTWAFSGLAERGENPSLVGLSYVFSNGLEAHENEAVRQMVAAVLQGNA